MRTNQRISELRLSLDSMRSELGKGRIAYAQALAAGIAHALEEWSFDVIRIPPDERPKYRSPNEYHRP